MEQRNLSLFHVYILFYTYVRCLQLTIPTVARVMSHFVRHVLPEAHLFRVNADLQHKAIDTAQEITNSRVGNNTLDNNNKKKKEKTSKIV